MAVILKDVIFRMTIHGHIPPTLNAGFLQGAGVVPAEWPLAQEAICTAEGSQLVFENGLILLAQGEIMSGQERLDDPASAAPQLAKLLVRYCQALPHLRCQELQTVLRAVVLYEQDSEGANRFMRERLLQPGDWQTWGGHQIQPKLQIAYNFQDHILNLIVAPSQILQDGVASGSALVFIGSFEHSFEEGVNLPQMEEPLLGWAARWDQLHEYILTKFPIS